MDADMLIAVSRGRITGILSLSGKFAGHLGTQPLSAQATVACSSEQAAS